MSSFLLLVHSLSMLPIFIKKQFYHSISPSESDKQYRHRHMLNFCTLNYISYIKEIRSWSDGCAIDTWTHFIPISHFLSETENTCICLASIISLQNASCNMYRSLSSFVSSSFRPSDIRVISSSSMVMTWGWESFPLNVSVPYHLAASMVSLSRASS